MIPSDAASMRETLADGRLLRSYFTSAAIADGTTAAFLDAYTAIWTARGRKAAR